MKSVTEQLSQSEQKLLALFYGTPTYNAVKKLIDIERLELAKDAIEQLEIGQVRWMNGGSTKLKGLLLTIKELNKTHEKKS
jgi:hypothetical protein